MKNTFKSTISAVAMLGLVGVGGVASADNHERGSAERAGSRAGASVDRAGNRVGSAADRTGDRVGSAADRTGDRMENSADRAGARTQGAAARTGDRLDGTRADQRVGANVDRDDSAGDKTGVKEEITDTWITTKVKSSFVTEDALDGSDISVDTERDGVVTLSGSVRSKSAKKRAEVVAKNVEGVKKVNNELKVVSTRAVSGRDKQ